MTIAPAIGLRFGIIALAAGMLAAGQATAFAAGQAATKIGITVKTGVPVITGDHLVVFGSGGPAKAHISGTATGVHAGEVIELFAQRFPFSGAPVKVGRASVGGTRAKYSFTVQPTLATRYRAEVLAKNGTTVLATSPRIIVYVAALTSFSKLPNCKRPVCHITSHIITTVPPATFATERAKHFFVYFGLKLSRHGEPAPPKTLTRGAGNPKVSAIRKLSNHVYEITLKLSFRINNDGFRFEFLTCQPDSEAKDGLNLPGHHGCGTKSISSRIFYLG